MIKFFIHSFRQSSQSFQAHTRTHKMKNKKDYLYYYISSLDFMFCSLITFNSLKLGDGPRMSNEHMPQLFLTFVNIYRIIY